MSAESIATIRANADRLGAGTSAVIHRADALRFAAKLGAGAYDIAFADPPYDLALATRLAEHWLDTPFASILGVEHRSGETLPGEPDTRRYGSTTISFYGLER